MVHDVGFSVTFSVMDSWEEIKRVENFEEVAGAFLFQRLFEECPPTKILFGFPIDMDPKCNIIKSSVRFLMHAKHFIQMIDRALNLLGPDIEILTEIMHDLGKKHAIMGVKSEYFAHMKEVLLEMVGNFLKEKFTAELKNDWGIVLDAFIEDILSSMQEYNKEKQLEMEKKAKQLVVAKKSTAERASSRNRVRSTSFPNWKPKPSRFF